MPQTTFRTTIHDHEPFRVHSPAVCLRAQLTPAVASGQPVRSSSGENAAAVVPSGQRRLLFEFVFANVVLFAAVAANFG